MDFLKCLCAGIFQPQASLSAFASLLSIISGCCVSKQALAKRINDECVTFIRDALFAAIGSLCSLDTARAQGLFRSFGRILIQDSTNISLPNYLASSFPGARNWSCRKYAGIKIQTIYDLLMEQFASFDLSPFRRTDQSASPDILKVARKGDLVLRDLGYFVLSVFKQMNNLGIYFLSRLRDKVVIYCPRTGDRINLLAELKKHQALDIDVLVGTKERVPMRLIAVPVPESVANKRRRKAKNNRDKRCRPSTESLQLLGWQILITNVERCVWSPENVAAIYGIRWRIEIIFKAWKSHFDLTTTPRGSKAQVEAHVLAKLLYITFFQVFFHQINQHMICKYNRPVSILKVAALLRNLPLLVLTTLSQNSLAVLEDIIKVHCSYEKRRLRQNYMEKLSALS